MAHFKTLLSLSPLIKRFFITTIIVSAVFEIAKIIPPYIFKEIIDTFVKFDPSIPLNLKLITFIIAGYALSHTAIAIIEFFHTRFFVYWVAKSEIDILKTTFKKLLNLDLSYHEQSSTGTSVNKMIRGSSKINELLHNYCVVLFPTAWQTIITVITLLFVSWEVSVSYLILVPLLILVIYRGSIKTQKARETYHIYLDRFAGTMTQALSNIRTVKDFFNMGKEYHKTSKLVDKYDFFMQIRQKLGSKFSMFEDFLVTFGRVVTLLISIWLLLNLKITAGELVFIITLTEKAYINLLKLSRLYHRIHDAEPSIERFKAIYDEPINVKDNPESKNKISNGNISFDNVSFKYPLQNRLHAIQNVSFKINPKQTVALVGRSGSGKSTIIKLLLRHFDTTSGKIFIDNNNIKDYSLKNLRKDIAIVSQDVELFNESIYENIAYGVENAKKADIIKVAKLAHAHEFILQFEKGYDSIVGERGIKLSGGQKQRIAIARALLRKPKIMVFDEATSSLDAESEKYIHKSIFNLIGNITLIIIAHRFATIEHADKIILLENGNVAEIGTHKELMKKKGIFAKLRKLQELEQVS